MLYFIIVIDKDATLTLEQWLLLNFGEEGVNNNNNSKKKADKRVTNPNVLPADKKLSLNENATSNNKNRFSMAYK